MKPYLVKNVSDRYDTILTTTLTKESGVLTDPETSEIVKEMMIEVVKNGTGKRASISEVIVAGKTGTAQNEKSSQGQGNDHAWFIGFAPASDPEIAIAVIIENQEKDGGQLAAPIAGKIMAEWINKNNKK